MSRDGGTLVHAAGTGTLPKPERRDLLCAVQYACRPSCQCVCVSASVLCLCRCSPSRTQDSSGRPQPDMWSGLLIPCHDTPCLCLAPGPAALETTANTAAFALCPPQPQPACLPASACLCLSLPVPHARVKPRVPIASTGAHLLQEADFSLSNLTVTVPYDVRDGRQLLRRRSRVLHCATETGALRLG